MNKERTIAIAVDGGQDTYVAADLARRLIRSGSQVRVAVTGATERWIPALTFATLTGEPVARSIEDGQILAESVDGVLVLASSAELISAMARGLAEDAASAVYLHSDAPRVVRPAESMPASPWVESLMSVVAEDSLMLPRGQDPGETAAAMLSALCPRDLEGCRVLITAGPTREFIDPVRFISSPSTGRMGVALARAASQRGADVTLLLGPTHIAPPSRVRTLRFVSAEELWRLAADLAGGADVVLAAAAVGDYAPLDVAKEKVKKQEGEWPLRLGRTPDVLRRLGQRFAQDPDRPILVGFAAETENVIDNARRKLQEKHLDLVVANDVSRKDIGFASEANEAHLVAAAGSVLVPKSSKNLLAHRILERVSLLREERRSNADPT